MEADVVCVVQPYYRLHGSHNNRLELGLHYMAEVLLDERIQACVYNGDYEPGDVYADWPSIADNAWNWTRAMEEGDPIFQEIVEGFLTTSTTHVIIGAGAVVTPTLNNGSVQGAARIAEIIKERRPEVKVIGYGPQFTFAESVPEVFDHVIHGEGEMVIGPLIRGEITERVVKGGLVPLEKMDKLPFLHASTMHPKTPVQPHDMDYISGSRGCLFRCHYCLVPTFQGKTRYMSPERYVAEMSYRFSKYGVRGLYFCDQTFTENKKRLVELCELISEKLPEMKWWAEARIETLKPETFQLMADSGCTSLKIGIEAGDPEMLKWFGKKTDLEKAREKIRLLQEVGIKPVIYVLLGTPGVNRENYLRSYEFMKSLEAGYYVVNVTTAARGTKMYDKVKPDLIEAGLYEEGTEEGFGHLSKEMRQFWGIDDDVFEMFMALVKGDDKEDSGTRRYISRRLR